MGRFKWANSVRNLAISYNYIECIWLYTFAERKGSVCESKMLFLGALYVGRKPVSDVIKLSGSVGWRLPYGKFEKQRAERTPEGLRGLRGSK